MQPPIPVGTILQNRYRILSILGQGGFGRTYLAEDQGRFNELCALKELIPAQPGAYALEKSKELFQREAAILYQIQHPQIPQFRATFEQDQRLFLVQDYVEGKTYRMLLDERKAQGYAFSEPEVVQLLRQLLPILAHIHSKGIVHRDIAPDNIILRERDRLPVLIDFGVVKELATRIQSSETVPQATTVGKLGFAPSEQIQAGRAYPSSDLYSLAVTAAVLLTGREPSELFDDGSMTWHWQRWTTVSPNLAFVLNRMLSYKPGDRYQSVSEVVQALQSSNTSAVTQPPVAAPSIAPPPVVPPANPDLSRVPTMAVGRRPDSTNYSAGSSNRPDPVIPTSTRSSFWDDPWAVGSIGAGLVLLTGIGSWALVSFIRNNQQAVQPTPTETVSISPSVTPTASKSPSPTPTSEPIVVSRRLDVGSNTTITIPGSLRANETVNYIISAQQGQQLSASLIGEGVLLTVLAPDNQPVDNSAKRRQQWQGSLPFDGSYSIQLSPVKGAPDRSYKLEVALANPAPPSPSPTTAPPSPIEVSPEDFGQNGTAIEKGETAPNAIQSYMINLKQGQSLTARISSSPTARLLFRFPNGEPVPDLTGGEVTLQVPFDGTYQIDVTAPQKVGFTLELNLEDAPPPP